MYVEIRDEAAPNSAKSVRGERVRRAKILRGRGLGTSVPARHAWGKDVDTLFNHVASRSITIPSTPK